MWVTMEHGPRRWRRLVYPVHESGGEGCRHRSARRKRTGPTSAHVAAAQRARPDVLVDSVRGRMEAAGSPDVGGDLGGRTAARDGRDRRARHPRSASEALERHGDRPRRRLAHQEARRRGAAWADAVGTVPVPALTVTKLSWLHRSEPDAWAGCGGCACPTTGSRGGSRATSSPTGATRRAPATGRRSRSGTGTTSSRSSEPSSIGSRCCPRCSGLLKPPASGPRRGAPRRLRHGRQHGGGTRHGPRSG